MAIGASPDVREFFLMFVLPSADGLYILSCVVLVSGDMD
jgi:hypothetical protein